ncbi:MAG: ribosomal protein S18-alanine N-acetyltransferase [Longimicrobiales bacterium]|nr:ribosomal protein S18-alanine N-acetyltransferase [Longimicrobiales bacterium]
MSEVDTAGDSEGPAEARSLPSGLAVRPMTEDDLDRVCEIEDRSFSAPWKRRTFRGLLPRDDAELWVAEIDSEAHDPPEGTAPPELVGYLVLWFVTDEGELADLAVDPEYRGRGVGGFLVGRAVDRARARGVRSLFLEVRESNEGALSLYRSRGFHVISVRKGYYSKPREDALVMLKSLW